MTSILIGLTIGCLLLPYGQRLHESSTFNATDVYSFQRNAQHLYDNLSKEQIAENEKILKNNNKLFPAFVLFVFFDVLGLPAIAISSVALFTKMVHYNMQGLGQGIQRGVLGISTICGPLFAGPFIHNPIVLIGFTFVFLIVILVIFVFTHKHIKPIEQRTVNIYTDEE
jgi:MFS family permease